MKAEAIEAKKVQNLEMLIGKYLALSPRTYPNIHQANLMTIEKERRSVIKDTALRSGSLDL